MKPIKTNFLVITDFNVLPADVELSWVIDFTDNYLIYDRIHRFEENDKIKHQPNVGANIYDIFDFIVNNYDNLPDTTIFCKSNVFPRHCGEEKFNEIINNDKFTPIENYIRNHPRHSPNIYSFVDEHDRYHEKSIEVNTTVSNKHLSRTVKSYQELLDMIFEDGVQGEYIRFAPGGNYIIPKKDILKYNKHFYETMRELVSWHAQPGEAYLLERAMCTIFGQDSTPWWNGDFKIKKEFKN